MIPRQLRSAALMLAAVTLTSGHAHAVVTAIDASVTAEVKQFLNGELGDSVLSYEDLDETSGNLPLVTEASLFVTEGGEDLAGGEAFASFFDPRASETPDPDAFGLDFAVFSHLDDVTYAARSNSTETREIVFLPFELAEPAGTELEVRSFFFLDGLLFVWGEPGQADLSDTTVELDLSVTQVLPPRGEGDEPETRIVLEAGLTVTGQADGTVLVEGTGALNVDNVTVADLTGTLPEFGPVFMIIIPATTAIPYLYPATVDEMFTLAAEIETRGESQPGTGATAQLGVPLLDVATLLAELSGQDAADLLEELLQEALNDAPAPARPLVASGDEMKITVTGRPEAVPAWPVPICGHVGIEAAFCCAALAMATGFRRRFR